MHNRGEISKIILLALGVAGLITVSIVAPNLVAVLGRQALRKKYSNAQLKRSLASLEKKKLVFVGQSGDQAIIELTENGQKQLLRYKLEGLAIKPQKKWDRKWRVVIFDIPEQYKFARQVFMRKLKELGFRMIQRSVWVYPYPCDAEIEVLKGLYEIIPFVKIITAERIDSEKFLIKDFKLN